MDLKELEKIMIEYGVVIRAIPMTVREVYAKEHIKKYPNGEIKYLPEYKKEMLVVIRVPQSAGKFVIESAKHTMTQIQFRGIEYFDTIEDAIKSLK